MTFTVTLNYPANVSAVSFSAKPPSGSWLHVATGGTNVPAIKPNTGDNTNPADANSVFGWSYVDVVPNSASFTFVVSYPSGLTGNQTINFAADYRLNGERSTITVSPLTLTATTTQTAPTFVSQPVDATVAAGATATFSATATGSPAATIKWQRSTDGGSNWSDLSNDSTYSGVTTPTLSVASTTLAMSGLRYRAMAMNGVSPDATSNVAVLTVTQAPALTVQPASQSVTTGSPVTFSVTATGSGTLAYQWYFTPAGSTTPQAISGATAATYTISSVQSANAGDYVCVVTNSITSTTSNAAQLSIVPRLVRIVNQTAAPSATVVVPVQLVASGSENALGFSVNFDPAQLAFVSAATGAQASDATLNTNSTQAASGRLGFALAKPAGATWTGGTQEVVKITFTLGSGVANGTVSSLSFGDVPVTREIASATAETLPGAYQGGTVTALSGFEADMNGNGAVTITDWVKVGRIVAGLDPAPTGIDFMKADCAPRSSLGNGSLSVTDWVQAGRYAAGLDPLTVVGGPTAP